MFYRVGFIYFALLVIPFSYGSNLIDFNKKFLANVSNELEKYSIPGAAYAIVQSNILLLWKLLVTSKKLTLKKLILKKLILKK